MLLKENWIRKNESGIREKEIIIEIVLSVEYSTISLLEGINLIAL